ncbi:MAG: O-antigen ligase family protein [Candidatus Eisenbacteria bacterium]|nr:O-antigen ligase family protein [Candidatus Eisenbacteria bacterium]MCC7143126.1 O-antigen ligase family protein [Candidatus Eisenbacteria bacterium]
MNRRIRYARPIHELIFSSWVTVPLALLLGAFVASQFFSLTPRYLKLGAGLLFLLAVTRLPLARSLALFSVIFVVPTFIFLADTNVLFLGLLMLVWLVQMTFGRASRPVRTPIDWAIWAYLGIHALSFINVDSTFGLMNGLGVMQFLVAGIVFFVLLVNGIRTEDQLAGVLRALSITSGFIFVTALVEFFGKGYQLVPEWFLYRGGHSTATGGRIGGIFGFHGLLADYSAMMFYLHLTQARRATKTSHRVWYGSLCVLCLVMIALSVNRGGAAIWVLGGLYYMWLQRERLRFDQIALAVPVLVVGSLSLEAITGKWLSRLTLFGRIANTQFQRGIPDTRIEAWTAILRKIPDHLWIGHGPFYDLKGGRGVVYWPHSAYLFYFYTTGFVGLMIFVWLIGKVIWVSRPRTRVNFVRGSMASAAQAVLHLQVLMFAVAQIRDEHQRGNVYVYLMWMLFALAVVATRLVKQGPPPATDEGAADALEPILRPRSASS